MTEKIAAEAVQEPRVRLLMGFTGIDCYRFSWRRLETSDASRRPRSWSPTRPCPGMRSSADKTRRVHITKEGNKYETTRGVRAEPSRGCLRWFSAACIGRRATAVRSINAKIPGRPSRSKSQNWASPLDPETTRHPTSRYFSILQIIRLTDTRLSNGEDEKPACSQTMAVSHAWALIVRRLCGVPKGSVARRVATFDSHRVN